MTAERSLEVRKRGARPAVLLVDGAAVDRGSSITLSAGALADLIVSEYRAGKRDGRRAAAPASPAPTANMPAARERTRRVIERDAKGQIVAITDEPTR